MSSSENRSDSKEGSSSTESPAEDEPVQSNSTGEKLGEEDATEAGAGMETPSETSTKFAECPNCGREFEGTYCPDCGQEVGRQISVGDVAGDFVREMADIEGGFRATFAVLTTRPVEALRQYLGGARTRLMSPGRYLLASVVINFVTYKGLIWLGVLDRPRPSLESAANKRETSQVLEIFAEAAPRIFQSQWFIVAITLFSTGLLALILWRLLSDELTSGAEALAVSAFLSGHVLLMSTGFHLPLAPVIHLSTGGPAGNVELASIGLLVAVAYVGAVVYGFTSSWKQGMKAGLGAFWAQIEALGIGGLMVLSYVLWRTWPLSSSSEAGGIAGMTVFYAIPLLIHGLVELYYWLRRI